MYEHTMLAEHTQRAGGRPLVLYLMEATKNGALTSLSTSTLGPCETNWIAGSGLVLSVDLWRVLGTLDNGKGGV